MDFDDVRFALDASAALDTCWPRAAPKWTPENPAWGHCVMYALYVNEAFGGDIIHMNVTLPNGEVISHYCNCVGGTHFDFAISQFRDGTQYANHRTETREQVLTLPDGERERYALFRERVRKYLGLDTKAQ